LVSTAGPEAVATILRQLDLIEVAEDFFPEQAEAARDVDDAAEDAIREGRSAAVEGTVYGGSIALAFAFVMISLNAMRVGLLSRFMGILGIFVGILLVIPLGVQILQLFWFAALGLLFLNRWPGGRGPAWESGTAEPWPTAAQRRGLAPMPAEDEAEEARLDPNEPLPEGEPLPERPASRKRRKKR
jgi:hypothetical protein